MFNLTPKATPNNSLLKPFSTIKKQRISKFLSLDKIRNYNIGNDFIPYRELGKPFFKWILYNVVYRDLLLDNSLSKFQRKLIRRLLELLAYRCNYRGYAFPTQQHVAQKLSASVPTIKKASDYLVAKGYIRRESNKWSYKYYILLHKTYEKVIRENINSTDGFSNGSIDWSSNCKRINCNKDKIQPDPRSLTKVTKDNYNNKRTTTSSSLSSCSSSLPKFEILNSIYCDSERDIKAYWEANKVHDAKVRDWILEFPKMSLNQLKRNLNYIHNRILNFRRPSTIKDPLAYLYGAIKKHNGRILHKGIFAEKGSIKNPSSTGELATKPGIPNIPNKVKQLPKNIQKICTESGITDVWLTYQMPNLSLDQITHNLEYSSYQQLKSGIKPFSAAYLAKSLKFYLDRTLPKPAGFKSEAEIIAEKDEQQTINLSLQKKKAVKQAKKDELFSIREQLNTQHFHTFIKKINQPEFRRKLIGGEDKTYSPYSNLTDNIGLVKKLYISALFDRYLKTKIPNKKLEEIQSSLGRIMNKKSISLLNQIYSDAEGKHV